MGDEALQRGGMSGQEAGWIKSSLSFSNSNCIEVTALSGGHVGIRHSKVPGGPVLRFTPGEWTAFLGGVRNGEFDQFGRPDGSGGVVGSVTDTPEGRFTQ